VVPPGSPRHIPAPCCYGQYHARSEQGIHLSPLFSFPEPPLYGPDSVDPALHASARKELRESLVGDSEAKAAAAERYGGERAGDTVRPQSTLGGGWIMGGPTVISFDHADVSFSLKGLEVFTDDSRYEIDLTGPEDGRDARLNSYYEAIVNGAPLPADGRWGLGTLEVLLAIERSSEARADVLLEHQGPSVD
jgi:phthalate 4,5-cis-dihydrodiol dehydrogenase